MPRSMSSKAKIPLTATRCSRIPGFAADLAVTLVDSAKKEPEIALQTAILEQLSDLLQNYQIPHAQHLHILQTVDHIPLSGYENATTAHLADKRGLSRQRQLNRLSTGYRRFF
jgi:hypothetical protein